MSKLVLQEGVTIEGLQRLVDALCSELAKAYSEFPGWISCSDDLPKRNGKYLVTMNQEGYLRGGVTRTYSQNKWHLTNDDKREGQIVTHWAEVPKLRK